MMAERRMFSKTIIGSARFLRMPQTSRLLYYDLGMAADDDGIVEAFTVLRTTGAAEDDLRVLVAKGFISVLNGDLVSYIRDWGANNQIRKDRYRPSIYAELLVKMGDGNQTSTTWQPEVNQTATEVSIGKDSLDKVSIDKSKSDKPLRATRFTPPTVDDVRAYCLESGRCIDAQQFVDFYEAKGWMVGKNKMRDWKACVRTWERRMIDDGNQRNTRASGNSAERQWKLHSVIEC